MREWESFRPNLEVKKPEIQRGKLKIKDTLALKAVADLEKNEFCFVESSCTCKYNKNNTYILEAK